LPAITRVTTRDARLDGQPVPAGTTVVFSPYTLHHRPELFPGPEDFDPGRWDDGGHGLRPPKGAFLAFGAGARQCIGDTFALTHAVLALSTIAARWQLRPVPGRSVRSAPRLVLSPTTLRLLPTAHR
jgi:pentalenene oxygenase